MCFLVYQKVAETYVLYGVWTDFNAVNKFVSAKGDGWHWEPQPLDGPLYMA